MGYIQRRDRPKPWLARYRGPDGRHQSKSFRRKVDAERWLTIEEGKTLRGEWLDPTAGTLAFGEWAESWLDGLHDIGPKTRAGYESLLRSRILPVFAPVELRRLTTASVRSWVSDMASEDLSGARIRQALQVLRASLDIAVSDGLIAKNPAAGVKAPRVEKRRQRFLTAFELAHLADETGEYGPLIWFLGWSGLRWGEAVALRVGRVDAEPRRVRVEEAASEVGGTIHFGLPKTHETRTVILPHLVMERIAPLVEERGDEDLVFTAPRGGPLRQSNFRRNVWRPAVTASGVPDDLLIHDLRDTAASLAISTGASIKAVQRMLGHASAAMTLDTYGSLFEEDLEALADRIDERYGGAHPG
ncbi:MAG TPA: tyrosine-type recombinase/integrase [Acidimicrobiia bacterium]|jgi:integrase|nr:tyrosine-type recombinase/integrase [Acidimicrobiia bacterium]